jgi:uncharacterized protein YdhG (YjbR/CyaY superfamily)
MKAKQKTTTAKKRYEGFSDEEKDAMAQRVKEMKLGDKGDMDGEVLAKISELREPDRSMAKRLHTLIRASAPELKPRLWYGMPAYAKDGKLICHFQPAHKFKTRYAELGFSDAAKLDDGTIWPVAYALPELTSASEAKIAALVRKAAG